MKRLLLALAVTISTIGLSMSNAYACRGPFPKTTLQKEAEQTSSIFLGNITSVTERHSNLPLQLAKPPGKIYEVRFQVSRSWKGQAQSEEIVLVDSSSCGLFHLMQPGDDWLVFAGGKPLYTSVFSRFTRSIQQPEKELQEVIKVLGKGRSPKS